MLGASSWITTPSANSRSITPPRARRTAIPSASASSAASPSSEVLPIPGAPSITTIPPEPAAALRSATADLLQLGLALEQMGPPVQIRHPAPCSHRTLHVSLPGSARLAPSVSPRRARAPERKPAEGPRSEARPAGRSVGSHAIRTALRCPGLAGARPPGGPPPKAPPFPLARGAPRPSRGATRSKGAGGRWREGSRPSPSPGTATPRPHGLIALAVQGDDGVVVGRGTSPTITDMAVARYDEHGGLDRPGLRESGPVPGVPGRGAAEHRMQRGRRTGADRQLSDKAWPATSRDRRPGARRRRRSLLGWRPARAFARLSASARPRPGSPVEPRGHERRSSRLRLVPR